MSYRLRKRDVEKDSERKINRRRGRGVIERELGGGGGRRKSQSEEKVKDRETERGK